MPSYVLEILTSIARMDGLNKNVQNIYLIREIWGLYPFIGLKRAKIKAKQEAGQTQSRQI